jgi:hypothetical protein
MVSDWHLQNVRPVVYINPYLADLEQFGIKSELYEEGILSKYFV